MKLLIVEDEKELAGSMIAYLESEHYLCEYAHDLHTAKSKIELYEYDCILLDIMLPDGSGMQLLEILKSTGKQDGVIIVSAKEAIDDKIAGLRMGADDYLAKPFHLSEMSARVQSLIRRRKFSGSTTIHEHELEVDIQAKSVLANGKQVGFTRKEYDLFLYLISNKNKVISKAALAEHLSGDLAEMFNNHDFVYAHIKNLKRKLADAGCADYIRTIYGMGYKWE